MQHYGVSANIKIGDKCLIRNRYGLPRLAEVSEVKDRFYIVKYEHNGDTYTEKFARASHIKWGSGDNLWACHCSFPQYMNGDMTPEGVLASEQAAVKAKEDREISLKRIEGFIGRARGYRGHEITEAELSSVVKAIDTILSTKE
jgi:hypothetical protein